MFKKTKDSKGFTLIEMLVVIAVIAILVSVIIPVVNGSTDKAAAATNASNLRGVEGEIITMMLMDPSAFGDQRAEQGAIDSGRQEIEENQDVEELEAAMDAAWDAYNNYDPSTDTELQNSTQELIDAKAKVENLEKEAKAAEDEAAGYLAAKNYLMYRVKKAEAETLRTSESAAQAVLDGLISNAADIKRASLKSDYETAKLKYETALGLENVAKDALDIAEGLIYKIYAINGNLYLDDGTVINAPTSKAVNKDDVIIDDDIQMVVYVDTINYQAYAYYPGDGVEYGVSDFAAAAE